MIHANKKDDFPQSIPDIALTKQEIKPATVAPPPNVTFCNKTQICVFFLLSGHAENKNKSEGPSCYASETNFEITIKK
ncbi:hypothetical protein GCM10007906_09670 [Vibrio hyugaensis]|uniref:Uncharacterized protein n=1 Tax=Vibrio hyugaensis TaxID=1534743 RepID=A0ABQ5XZT2_9VIBR|nr:hypothetical protein GCM10007906_09670 [Vibrio hyugaensis]